MSIAIAYSPQHDTLSHVPFVANVAPAGCVIMNTTLEECVASIAVEPTASAVSSTPSFESLAESIDARPAELPVESSRSKIPDLALPEDTSEITFVVDPVPLEMVAFEYA